MTDHIFACRTSVYPETAIAFERLPDAGITAAELCGFTNEQIPALSREAAAAGVRLTTLGLPVDLSDEASVANLKETIAAAADHGVAKLFVSVGVKTEQERTVSIQRLRALAETAADSGVTLCMETHLPFGHNADEALRTIDETESEGLRVNFDTANIYYYNRNIDGTAELARVRNHLGSIHLKDTDGTYHSMNFPVLGQGIVDFPAVFRLCDEVDFQGPFTLELEGPLTSGKSVDERHAAVKASMEYLRSIGAA